uniref:C2H2-type domain-containing protein n=1 Tax=Meloidogyne enterolobii TaxID=390850 RepID=A0A6V7X5I2_MELEN|nr:unnamed protein product [Meloidogyne enterolobii]
MQNLAASANLQLFSKALQETAQQPNDTSEHKQQQQQNPVISAADLQHYMFPHLENHLDQQLYFNDHLSNNYVSAPETTSTINNCSSTSPTSLIFSSTASQQPSNNTVISSNNCYSDTEIPSTTTTNNISFLLPEEMGSPKQQQLQQQQQQQQQRLPPTTSIKKETSIATTTNVSSSSVVPQFSPTSNIENERNLNLAQQKIVDQLLEAGGIFNSLENNLGGGNDELGQLMAQLISGSNNRNETELQAAQLAQHLVAATTGGSGGGGDVLSPSSSQQQISLLDQLHLLQMLGGNNNALAELFSGQHFATSSGHEQQLFGSGGGGSGGKFTSGGSPNKDDTYCEICNKNLCNRYFLKIHMNKKHGIGGERSPVKLGNSNFFNYQIPTSTEQQQNSQQLPGGLNQPPY